MSTQGGHIQLGFTAVTPYLHATPALRDFLVNAFDAVMVHEPVADPEGRFHAEARIGGAYLMFGDGYFADATMKAAVYLYVLDVDTTFRRATALGAQPLREPADQTWGDRVAGVKDPSGNTWWIATHRPAR